MLRVLLQVNNAGIGGVVADGETLKASGFGKVGN